METLAIVGTGLQAFGAIKAGNDARAEANYEAAAMDQQAGQQRAVAIQAANQERRKATLAMSKAGALAAASGAGATDPTVETIQGNLAGEGEYNALSQLYTGEEKARGLEDGASAKRFQGQQAQEAGVIKGATNLFSGTSSLLDKYGDPFDSTDASTPWIKQVKNGSLAPNAYTNYG